MSREYWTDTTPYQVMIDHVELVKLLLQLERFMRSTESIRGSDYYEQAYKELQQLQQTVGRKGKTNELNN